MNCKKTLYLALRNYVKEEKVEEVVVVCIGTDRSTGDSLGPFVGTYLKELKLKKTHLYGTIHDPVHAKNLEETLTVIQKKHPDAFVIAVDACLGKIEKIGKIVVQHGPLRPGAGVGKNLPPVGNVSIKAIVNIGGTSFSGQILQNTRLSMVINMASDIKDILKKLDDYLKRKKSISVKKTLQEVAVTEAS